MYLLYIYILLIYNCVYIIILFICILLYNNIYIINLFKLSL